MLGFPLFKKKTEEVNTPGIRSIKNIIAVASGKGGVGKSTVTTHLAVALQKQGARVGILDADIYGPTQSVFFGSATQRSLEKNGAIVPLEKHGISFVSLSSVAPNDAPVVWRAPIANKLISQFILNTLWGDLDYLLIDLPPGTGDIQLTLTQQASLTGAVIVTTPQEVAVGIARRGLKMFQQVNVPILGIIENMSGYHCDHCGKESSPFKEGGGRRLAEGEKVPFLGALPIDTAIMKAGDNGIPVLIDEPKSSSSIAFFALATELKNQISRTSVSQDGTPQEISISEKGALLIKWKNAPELALSGYTARIHCGCASCVDENTGKKILKPESVDPEIKVTLIQPVGRYGYNFHFSDGHTTGIYPYPKLKVMNEERPTTPSQIKKTPSLKILSVTTAQEVIDREVNPKVASHGGKIEVIRIESRTVFLKMEGGCQGCSASQMTLKQGVDRALRDEFPEIEKLVDLTDHTAGKNPFFKDKLNANTDTRRL